MSKENKDIIVIGLMLIVLYFIFFFLQLEDIRHNLLKGRHLELIEDKRYAIWVDCNEESK